MSVGEKATSVQDSGVSHEDKVHMLQRDMGNEDCG